MKKHLLVYMIFLFSQLAFSVTDAVLYKSTDKKIESEVIVPGGIKLVVFKGSGDIQEVRLNLYKDGEFQSLKSYRMNSLVYDKAQNRLLFSTFHYSISSDLNKIEDNGIFELDLKTLKIKKVVSSNNPNELSFYFITSYGAEGLKAKKLSKPLSEIEQKSASLPQKFAYEYFVKLYKELVTSKGVELIKI